MESKPFNETQTADTFLSQPVFVACKRKGREGWVENLPLNSSFDHVLIQILLTPSKSERKLNKDVLFTFHFLSQSILVLTNFDLSRQTYNY